MKLQYTYFLLLIMAMVLFLPVIIIVAAPPASAVKLVILKPDDSTVGTPVIVTIEAQDSEDQVDIAYQNDVTLAASGSATGAGLVDIVNGIGTIEINDSIVETVTLSLSDTEATGLDVSSTEDVDFEAVEGGVAVKFIISEPSSSTVGTPVIVTIEAQDSEDQVDIAYQNDVTLAASGSATGAGLVDIVNGIGTIEINDSIVETVTLSLSDTEATGLDVSSTEDVDFEAVEEGDANWDQQKFWFRDDDGDEISATGFGAEDVNQNANIINVTPGTNFRLRFAIKLTNADGNIAPQLEFKEGADCTTGSWTIITPVSSVFNLQLSPNFIDAAATTQRLVGDPSFIAGQILESTNPAGLLSLLKNESTEYEWSLKVSPDTPLATTYSFRIADSGADLNTYDQCPSLTTQAPPSPPSLPPPTVVGGWARPTTVIFSGRTFPGAKILVVDKPVVDTARTVSQEIVSQDDGFFETSFVNILQSRHSFGLIIKDKEGRISQTKFFTIDIFANDLIVKDVVASPIVDFASRLVTRGDNATIIGYASPESNVVLEIDGIIKKEVKAEKDGSYKAEIATGEFDFGNHQVRAKQIVSKENRESDFSPTNTLVVSRLILPKTDLSGDGKVNIKDWSMFLFQWASKDMAQKKIIDFNEDGKVDISDFSIFIRNIRKI